MIHSNLKDKRAVIEKRLSYFYFYMYGEYVGWETCLGCERFFDLLPLGDGLQQRQQVAVHALPEGRCPCLEVPQECPTPTLFQDRPSRQHPCPCYVECSERHFAGLATDGLLFLYENITNDFVLHVPHAGFKWSSSSRQ